MKTSKQLHLWIGLFASVLILIEAVTGILMTEPWLMGANSPQFGQRQFQFDQSQTVNPANSDISQNQDGTQNNGSQNLDNAQDNGSFPDQGVQGQEFQGRGRGFGGADSGSGLVRVIRNLHAGRIGNTDISLLADLAAIALIFLTATGIILSVRTLKAQSKADARRNFC